MKTQEVVVSFMADCRLRNLSRRTLEGYHKYPPKPEVIQVFLATLTPYSADAHYRTWRAISNYAHKRHRTPNFMKSVTHPRVPKQIMPTISETELRLLPWRLENAPLRNKAIFALFIDTAIRKGEAINLKRQDILEDRIVIHGKTGFRVAPISEVTRDLLLSLPIHDDGFVFHGTHRYRDKPLGSTGFYKIVKKYLSVVGYMGKQFGPQILRRSFGRFWLKDGGDMKSLSRILGHKSIKTTDDYYTPLLTEDVIQIHHKHTPGRVFENVTH
jgi:integrase/recombinase XerD